MISGLKCFRSVRNGIAASLMGALALCLVAVEPAHSVSFTVTDSDFVGGVYDFHYRTRGTDRTIINGVNQDISTPFLTNNGWNSATDGTVDYFQGNNNCNGFGGGSCVMDNLMGDLTMGWDFSGISGQIGSIELKTRHFLFQFSPWNDESAGDKIAAYLSTPNTFGTGTETQLYEFTGTLGNFGTIGSGTLNDITSFLSGSWLANPNLLELRLAYDLVDNDIPGRHLQVFRDDTGSGDDGFVFRATLQETVIPIPAALPLLLTSLAGLGLIGWRRRKTA